MQQPNNQFVPHKPQEVILVKITKREAVLLQKIRRHAYGKFVVHKSEGLIIRVEINNSELIETEGEITLE